MSNRKSVAMAASEVLGKEHPKRKEILFDMECEQATAENTIAYNRMLQSRTRNSMKEYRTKRKRGNAEIKNCR